MTLKDLHEKYPSCQLTVVLSFRNSAQLEWFDGFISGLVWAGAITPMDHTNLIIEASEVYRRNCSEVTSG